MYNIKLCGSHALFKDFVSNMGSHLALFLDLIW